MAKGIENGKAKDIANGMTNDTANDLVKVKVTAKTIPYILYNSSYLIKCS